jgi:hypothetical protein
MHLKKIRATVWRGREFGQGTGCHGTRRMGADDFRAETSRDNPLRRLLVRYNTAFPKQISQAEASNGLHECSSGLANGC